MTKILVIDNYDSFVFTLVGYIQQLGAETTVVRNDEISVEEAIALAENHDGVLVSPGPGAPADAGVIIDVIRWAKDARKPLLGVCLGHQAIAEAFGATVSHAPELMHGKTSSLVHEGDSVFKNLPSPFTATRYHSLAVEPETVPAELRVTSRTDNGIIMGLAHTEAPLHGVQFHPESVLTEGGYLMLGNWLEEVGGIAGVAERASALSPLVSE
ncbi:MULTISPECIES: aminodeoxychorismate/anthranilate synthase component II [unclassified Rothia (in: high G+C Gram-positive bacteria)]|uniref:aminodeoxychorismate/anthranilate synthase component II n=1 Tax=unclassified Rothia (in: high G+C Gram-positive bacteria) TaxID=2689056 RepID=UPI00195EA74F|nr:MULTISPECIES: aminodeoxychorismate/anthranilate synthase component II [unclassified Rothia (in: high G+C Gram-positive bacteria)]MBM7052271.1 aminodeoxychorismate/anthranilate synthase component II [Rothia sp. ZJ1223]QRZ61529.1 aminodeoxychorismate/anthranilate synthase component II [Rothia sp. ZJ932]